MSRGSCAAHGQVAITELALCSQRLESKIEVTQPRPDDGIGKAILVSHPEEFFLFGPDHGTGQLEQSHRFDRPLPTLIGLRG